MKVLQYIWKSTALKLLNEKMGTFLLIMAVICWTYNSPMRLFVQSVHYPVSWCVFPFFLASFGFLIFFWFGVIYVNSDVPFMQSVNMYHIIRTGRKRWLIGQIGGIFLRSLILVMVTVACTILTLLPYIEWSNEWGKVLRTLAATNVMESHNFEYYIYYEIFNEYTPFQLMALSIVICTLVCTFIGILMLFLCLYVNKICAVAGATALSVLLFLVINLHPMIRYKVALFVPTIWVEIAKMFTPEIGYYWLPSIYYMLSVLLISIIVMSLFIMRKVKTIEFQWENDDI